MTVSRNVSVEVWSDIACPWCWVGKRNLAKALEAFEGETEVRRRAYELNPNARRDPPASVDYVERLARKYGSTREQAQEMIDRMVGVGREVGVEMRFDRIQPSNTFDAHRLLAWARGEGLAAELEERLFRAYLHEGEWIGGPQVLVRLAADVGLDEEAAREIVESEEFGEQVRSDEEEAMQLGIRGVPFFAFDRRLALSGAQPPDVLLDVLRRTAAGEERPASGGDGK